MLFCYIQQFDICIFEFYKDNIHKIGCVLKVCWKYKKMINVKCKKCWKSKPTHTMVQHGMMMWEADVHLIGICDEWNLYFFHPKKNMYKNIKIMQYQDVFFILFIFILSQKQKTLSFKCIILNTSSCKVRILHW